MLHKKYFEQNTYSEEGLFDIFKKKFTEEEENILKKAGDEVRELFQKNYKRFFPLVREFEKQITNLKKDTTAIIDDLTTNKIIVDNTEDDAKDAIKLALENNYKSLEGFFNVCDKRDDISKDILDPFYKIIKRFKVDSIKNLLKDNPYGTFIPFFKLNIDDQSIPFNDLEKLRLVLYPIKEKEYPWDVLLEHDVVEELITDRVFDRHNPVNIMKNILDIKPI